MKQRIALLGSTGSIGIQTLDIVRENPGLFEITTLTAHRNWERLARQAVEFDADSVVIADERQYDALRQALDGTSIKVYAGEEALRQVVQSGQVDVVVNALVGYVGLMPTIAAVEAGKKVALANKETLVAGGCYVMPLAARHKAPIVPIDSEHSAIFQCLAGEKSPVRRLIVTCSGGAFRDRSREELAHVTVEQALKHPQWRMGDKITIDSATLVNKGFEVIEAHWLFGVPAERISVLIHPQSIVHSMVEFGDGAIKAQLGSPDMRTPIAYALSFPQRLDRPVAPFSFAEHPTLTFAEVDRIKYPALTDHGAVECGGSFGVAPQDEQVLLDVGCSLPRVADGDECRGLGGCASVRERQTVGGEPAYVESRGVGRGIYGLGEGPGIEPGSAATAEAEGGQEGQEE